MILIVFGQYYFSFQLSIAVSDEFLKIVMNAVFLVLLGVLGLFSIVYQIMYGIHKIVECITNNSSPEISREEKKAAVDKAFELLKINEDITVGE
jgi:hypothetical protein